LSKSVKLRPEYDDFSLFSKTAVAAILHFQNFKGRRLQEGRTASPCQIWSKSVELLPRYGDFLFFQDGRRPPSWICCVGDWTTHEWRLVVITVQNLVELMQ